MKMTRIILTITVIFITQIGFAQPGLPDVYVDLKVRLIGQNHSSLTNATVYAFSINDKGLPYDTAYIQNITSNDSLFHFEKFKAGEYLIYARPEDELMGGYYPNTSYLPSYHDSNIYWEEASALKVQRDTFLTFSLARLDRPVVDGSLDIEIDVENTVNAHKSQLCCQLLKYNNGSYFLESHTFTDENGEASFQYLEPWTYKVRIDYPGLAMIENDSFLIEEEDTGPFKTVVTLKIESNGIKTSVFREEPILSNNSTSLNLFPNPANEYVQFSNTKADQELIITDLSGQTILMQKTSSNQTIIHVSELADGIYLLHVPSLWLVEKIRIRH